MGFYCMFLIAGIKSHSMFPCTINFETVGNYELWIIVIYLTSILKKKKNRTKTNMKIIDINIIVKVKPKLISHRINGVVY